MTGRLTLTLLRLLCHLGEHDPWLCEDGVGRCVKCGAAS